MKMNIFHNTIAKCSRIIAPFIFIFGFFNNQSSGQTMDSSVIIKGSARFTVIAPECIRIEYSENNKFIDNRTLFAENRNARCTQFTKKEEGSKLIIETKKFRLTYIQDGKSFSPENLEIIIKNNTQEVKWIPGMKNKANLGGTISTLDQVRGKVTLDDGLLSRDGWYLLDDSKEPILTDDWVTSRPKDSSIDWYFFAYGSDYKAALKAMTKIAGKIPLPRKYVLGSWYSRYWPYSSDEYRQIVKEYEENDFPLDVMVMDMDWHKDGWTGWSWNRNLLPDAEKLLDFFHENNLRVTLNVHPSTGIAPHEDMYNEFMKDLGIDLNGIPENKYTTLPYDAGDKNYLTKLFKHTHTPLEKSGVDFWWLDWQQFKFTKSIPDLKNLPWLNRYYFEHTAENGNRGISFSRWGGWGDHKYPIHFSGDALSTWPMLEFEVPFTSTAGNIGCFFWSHDIGGHFGGLNPETNARWVQFGATTAALRLHSTRDKLMDKRPWLYDKMYIKSNQIAFHLRSVIFPYIYSSAWQSTKETIPLNKPMYIEYPDKEIAYASPQQYFFGEAFLIAPIAQPGIGKNKIASQKVWFPEGIWYNWFTNERYEENTKPISVWANIFEFPFYAKGGIPIPMQPYTHRMTSEPLKQLIIRVYPGEDGKTGKFTLYEDDGISDDYLKEKFALTDIQYVRNGDNYKVKISPVKGNYNGQLKSRSYVIEFPCTQEVDSAVFNGKKVKAEYSRMQMNNT
jgi:alpha-glucosidase (family GH31 glycosyl hydrolase)